jgi:hypothetical protein
MAREKGATLLPNGCEAAELEMYQNVTSTGQKNPSAYPGRINTLEGKIVAPAEP